MDIVIKTWHTRLYLLCLTMLLPYGLWAQISIKGRVLDADSRTPLAYSNVRLLSPEGKLQAGQATDKEGRYTLKASSPGTYTLEVSYVGYKSYKELIKLERGTQAQRDILLKEDGKLGEVTVVGKATEVVVKGDTIEYNAGSYRTAEGDAIIELIKKLPGAEVDEQGNVTVNGKSISQIMVDGKRFFSNDPKVALKNLPAELVEKVQVLSRASDNERLTGFADGDDETVINLSIKPGRKKGLFGSAFAGVGTQKRYEASALMNKFSDTRQFSVLGGINNTNNAGFSDISSDLAQSGLSQLAGGGGRRFGGRTNEGITTSHVLGANAILNLSSSLQTGGNATLAKQHREVLTKRQTSHIRSSGNTLEQSESRNDNNNWNIGTQLRLEWKPSTRTEIILSPQLSYGTGYGRQQSQARTDYEASGENITTSKLEQAFHSRQYDTRLQLDLGHKLSEKGRNIALSLEGRISNQEDDRTFESETFVSAKNNKSLRQQKQDNEELKQEFRVRASYVEPLGANFSLQLSYQLRGQFTTAERDVYDFNVTTGAYDVLNEGRSYDLSSRFLAHRAGFALKRSNKVYDLTAGLNVDPSELRTVRKYSNRDRVIEQNITNFSPTLRFVYKPSKALNLRIDYRGQSNQPTARQLSPVNDNSNPLVQYIGNEHLRPSFRHNLFTHLNLFWAERQSSFNAFFGLNLTENSIVNKSIYDNSTGVRTIGYDNVQGDWGLRFGGFYTRPIWGKKLSLRLSTRNNYDNSVGFSDGERNVAKALRLHEEISLAYRQSFLDTSLKFIWGYYSVRNSLSKLNSPSSNDYSLHWDSHIDLPLNLRIESQVQHTASRGYAEGYNFDQTLVNMSLSYHFLKAKAATIRLKVYDLLGQERSVHRQVSALSVSSQETNILGRYAMLQFIYKFNSFSGNASRSDMRGETRRMYPRPTVGTF